MNKLIIAALIVLFSFNSFGQVSKVRTLLDSSFVSVKGAWNSANKAVDEIQKCNISTSVQDLKFNADKAKSALDEATMLAENAETEVDGASGEADNINCTDTKNGAEKAEKYFKKAKDKFNDASALLSPLYDVDDPNTLIEALNNTLSSIEKGMDFLKKGTNEMKTAFDNLNNCRNKQ
jgi:hypothetical protein